MIITILEYQTEEGFSPFTYWFDGLNAEAATKIRTAVARLELGNTSNIKWFTGIGEYIINWGPGYRIYLAKEGEQLILLLGGGTKKTQTKDIEKAKAFLKEYKARKKRSQK